MADPIEKFTLWFNEARQCKDIADATAMALATSDSNAIPSLRIVLLKAVEHGGFVFYTNLKSHKSFDLEQNPYAALCFYWAPLNKQVRIEGRVERVGDDEADTYFATRSRESQIGAWASQQSQELADRETLIRAVETYTKQFEKTPVPRPPFWSGWRVVPDVIEFWQQGEFRLHHREVYLRGGDGWVIKTLYP